MKQRWDRRHPSGFTDRQRAVWALYQRGLNQRQISRALGVKQRSVLDTLRACKEKLYDKKEEP